MDMEEKKLETNTEQNLPVQELPVQRPARVLRLWNLQKLGGERRTMDPDHSRSRSTDAVDRTTKSTAFAFLPPAA